jgi:cell division protein FtsA
LIGGIVLTGGGSQLNHLKQLVEYITGMDTRLGYPSEHLAGNNSIEISSPMYATAVGLVMNSTKVKKINDKEEIEENIEPNSNNKSESKSDTVERTTIFERFTQSLKTFLDNAE